jgi:uncharacterized protein YyaL (SSP411 family)
MNKYAIYLLIALTGILTSFKTKEVNKPKDADLKWYDWNEGFKIADKKDKLILVDVYTSWCGWCKRMDHDTYADAGIQEQIKKDFVPVKLNPEQKDMVYKVDTMSLSGFQLLDILTNYQRSGYPTIIILNPRLKKVMLAQAGYQDANQFKQTLANAVASKNGTPGQN